MRAPYLDDGDVRLYLGDCLDVLAEMEPESVDAVVCDPPYGLEFMGKDWDSFRVDDPGTNRNRGEHAGAHGEIASTYEGGAKSRVAYGGGKRATTSRCTGCGKRDQFRNKHECAPNARWAEQIIDPYAAPPTMLAFEEWVRVWSIAALRVLKPGGHLLAFGGTRTFHRLTCGIEDAGFEIRDCLSWLYGSGFPKSLDVSKAIDKAAGAEREVVGTKLGHPGYADTPTTGRMLPTQASGNGNGYLNVTAPATDAAREWQGWGTALKPGFEPCVVARKPLAGTVAENVQAHGTGALNIDGCRIGTTVETWPASRNYAPGGFEPGGRGATVATGAAPADRWPANVALDEQAAAMLDAQSGERRPATSRTERGDRHPFSNGTAATVPSAVYADKGGASRFYFVSKEDTCDPANTADAISNPQSGHADSALSDAATSEHRADTQPTPASSPARSTNGTGNECEPRSASDTEPIQTSASAFSHESRLDAPTLTRNRASDAEPNGPTGITTTTPGQPISAGFAASAISASTSPSAEHGVLASLPIDAGGTRFHYTAKASRSDRTSGGIANNTHPTVKPTDLMRWLVRLVTPPGGLVLDPFAGSGSTLVAARAEGFRAIGIEREEEYADIIADRLSQLSLFSEAL